MKISATVALTASIVIVFAATALTLSPSLQCFYFSEDLIHCFMAFQALGAHPELLTQYLTAPFFQCSNMGLFYRPIIELSFVTDTLLYGRNLAGFHLTNVISHCLSAVFCLLITRHLVIKHVTTASRTEATWIGLVAGLLFGLNPLQGETIYWIICRCDCFCTMFSLAGLYLAFLASGGTANEKRNTNGLLWTLSVVAFILALLSKEQSFMVPFLLFLYFWMFPSGHDKNTSESGSGRLKGAAVLTAPFAIILALALGLRFIILGSIGGYHGTIGYMLNETPIIRFISPIAWNKIFYPLDQNAFAQVPWFPLLYSLTYLLMALGCWVAWQKNVFENARYKVMGYLTASAFIVLLPVVQSFVILESLYGARYAYMFQAFISMALALLLFCLRPKALRNALLPLYLILLLCTNVANNKVWTARGNDLRALQSGINDWAKKTSPDRKICVLNLPLDEKEFSSLYDLEQIRCLLKPPANDQDISNRAVQTSYLRMTSDCADRSRLKRFVEEGNVDFVISSLALANAFKLVEHSEMLKHFQPINQDIHFFNVEKPPETRSNTSTQAIELDLKDTPCPQSADYVEVLTAPKAVAPGATEDLSEGALEAAPQRAQPVFLCPDGKTVFVIWYSNLTPIYPAINWSTARFIDDKKQRRYLFPFGDRISWKCADRVDKLILGELPVDYKVLSVKLRDESTLVPTLTATGTGQPAAGAQSALVADDYRADGMLPVNEKQSVRLSYDATKLEGAQGVILYLSLPDFLYAPYVGGFREFELDKHNLKTVQTSSLSGSMDLARKDFPQPGKYQVRVAACDKDKKVLGYCSDPIELIVTDKPFEDAFQKALFNLRAQRQN